VIDSASLQTLQPRSLNLRLEHEIEFSVRLGPPEGVYAFSTLRPRDLDGVHGIANANTAFFQHRDTQICLSCNNSYAFLRSNSPQHDSTSSTSPSFVPSSTSRLFQLATTSDTTTNVRFSVNIRRQARMYCRHRTRARIATDLSPEPIGARMLKRLTRADGCGTDCPWSCSRAAASCSKLQCCQCYSPGLQSDVDGWRATANVK
jgi:hypothetical protein